jgi:lipid A 3-O-deacylase
VHTSAERITRLAGKVAAFLIVMLLGAGPSWGQTRAPAPSDATFALGKGSVEIGAIGGFTLPVSWLRAHADRHITMASLDIGRVMTGAIGEAPLGGNFEFLLEITPFLLLQQPARTFGLTISPLHMRWNFASARRARVFAEASGGIIYTGQPVPARTTTFNFIDQAGFGVRIADTARRAWLVGYRFQHISNAGRVKPNPGANFNLVYGGVTFLR